MAAVELGYDYTGIELDAKYVDIATKRIEAWWDKTHPQAFANPLFTIDEEEE
jgi:DNA modification methylase